MKLTNFAHLPRDTRDTLFLLGVIAWIILPQLSHLPWWTSLLAGAVLLWRGWLAVGGRALPGRWWLLGLLVVALGATWATHRTLLGRDAGVTLVVVLLTLKTLELRARRDALVVFFLGFFVMLTSFFYSQSLLTAAAMLVALLGLLTALVNAHRPVGQPSLRESAWAAARMALAGAPIMLALFVFFPRFAPLWGIPSDTMVGRSGLSSTMEVGALAELALDDGTAMRVRFDGEPPAPSALYFRGPVLDRFDGRQWTAGDNPARPTVPGDVQVSGAPVRYETTLEPSRRPWLLTLDVTPTRPALAPGQPARLAADLQWTSPRPVAERLRYRAEGYPNYRYGVTGQGGHPRDDLDRYLRLPAGYNPRTLALADEMRQMPGANPQALVAAALERLRTGGYTYTLEPGVTGRDTADAFWFDTKAGFCEHISSAFVILLRAAGVPARIVTGFQGGEPNPVGGFWTVRNADAHAWAEVWLADRGWVRVDPTGAVSPGRVGQFQRLRAPEGAIAGAVGRFSPTLLARLRATWEAVNNSWNQWVLDYTQNSQFDVLRKLGFESPGWADLGKVLGGLVAASALLGAAWARWERGEHDPWTRLLTRARRRLARAGIDAPPQAPPRELLRRVQASTLPPDLRQRMGDWLLALERLRYAPASATTGGATLAKLQREFRQLSWPAAAQPPA